MFLDKASMESAGLHVEIRDEHGNKYEDFRTISVQGTRDLSHKGQAAFTRVSEELGLTARDHDDAISYMINLTVWRTLKQLSD